MNKRGINGFKAKTLFRRSLSSEPEWAYNLRSNEGVVVYIPPHFFEAAYRRVKTLDTPPITNYRHFTTEEITKLIFFIRRIEEENNNKNYGAGTINLILTVANAAINQRKGMVNKLNNLSPRKKESIQKDSLKIRLKNYDIHSPFENYANLITSQKIKFSSRIKRYPFVFSLISRDEEKILLNTVYLKGDKYPKNTIIVYSI